MNSLFVSTTGTDVELTELGTTLVHPKIDEDLGTRFSAEEIRSCSSLTTAIQAGTLTWKKTAGGVTELPANYDPDYLEIEEFSDGKNDQTFTKIKTNTFSSNVEEFTSSAGLVRVLTLSNSRVQRAIGGTANQNPDAIVRLPIASGLEVGSEYVVFNDSNAKLIIQDNSQNEIIVLNKNSSAIIYLFSGGIWKTVGNVTIKALTEFEAYSSNAVQTTTSSNWVTKTGYPYTSEIKSKGFYVIDYSSQSSNTKNNSSYSVRVQWRQGTTGTWIDLLPEINRKVAKGGNIDINSGFGIVEITQDSVIQVQWQFGRRSGGTVSIRNAAVKIGKVADEL